jgi:hypothetical protein
LRPDISKKLKFFDFAREGSRSGLQKEVCLIRFGGENGGLRGKVKCRP